MKLLFLSLGLFLLSCTNSEHKVNDIVLSDMDSIVVQSQKGVTSANTINKKSDSVIKRDVVKIVYKIKYLNNEIEKYKTERITLMEQLKTTSEKVRIDTVYIETKKNFWGKEKTNIKVTSDSTIKTSIDSISKQKIDSLQ